MIAELLKQGKSNKVTFEYLKNMTGCQNERKLRRMIADERKQGAIILSCSEGGYFLPSNRGEVENYVNTMSKEAKAILFTLKHCKKYLKTTESQ
jgi:hypothetical protein